MLTQADLPHDFWPTAMGEVRHVHSFVVIEPRPCGGWQVWLSVMRADVTFARLSQAMQYVREITGCES